MFFFKLVQNCRKHLIACYVVVKLTLFSKAKEISQMFSNLNIVYLNNVASCVVFSSQFSSCNSSYYGKSYRHLKLRYGEHISVSPVAFIRVKPSMKNFISDHCFFCDHFLSFDDFIILAHGTNTFLFEIRESLLIKHHKPGLNKNISYVPLFLFD